MHGLRASMSKRRGIKWFQGIMYDTPNYHTFKFRKRLSCHILQIFLYSSAMIFPGGIPTGAKTALQSGGNLRAAGGFHELLNCTHAPYFRLQFAHLAITSLVATRA